ncbi:hypothetical protein DENSPDRAFT_835228 [Dentipellis sp. KUC8613]|nr:hypothetical protein DENSPDRAFT_835228 [Dentipellis sp. KUC8613]
MSSVEMNSDLPEVSLNQLYDQILKDSREPFDKARAEQQIALETLLGDMIRPHEQLLWLTETDISHLPSNVQNECTGAIHYLHRLRDGWRSEKITIPVGWNKSSEDILDASSIQPWLERLNGKIHFIPDDEVKAHHDDLNYVGPDFLLSDRPEIRLLQWDEELPTTRKTMLRSGLSSVLDLLSYDGEEKAAEKVVPGLLASSSQCWLKCPPHFSFHPPLEVEAPDNSIDFILALRGISSASYPEPTDHDVLAPITIAHPALLVGAKGPACWTSTRIQYESKVKQRHSLFDSLQDINAAAQSSLMAHILNWKCGQSPNSLLDLSQMPAEIMVLGVIYDANSIRIVGCFPQITADNHIAGYVSVVIDELPFSGSPSAETDSLVSRLRVVAALLTLQRHAYKLASYWTRQDTNWHRSILDFEKKLEEIYIEEHNPDIMEL